MQTDVSPRDLSIFWEHVQKDPNGCWLWTGYVDRDGYGRFPVMTKGKRLRAHQFSYILHRGAILGGLCVLHNCPAGDNPRCVNPDHLWLGTLAENARDRDKKGRHRPSHHGRAQGERHGNAKLTNAAVMDIRVKRALPPGQRPTLVSLAEQYGVKKDLVWKVANRRVWTHLP